MPARLVLTLAVALAASSVHALVPQSHILNNPAHRIFQQDGQFYELMPSGAKPIPRPAYLPSGRSCAIKTHTFRGLTSFDEATCYWNELSPGYQSGPPLENTDDDAGMKWFLIIFFSLYIAACLYVIWDKYLAIPWYCYRKRKAEAKAAKRAQERVEDPLGLFK